MIDLVTLVTLCSLSVDPKLMHALVWHQSGGEPWSFTLPGEREPRVYRKLRDAVREANALHTDRPIRVGLAGLVTNASAAIKTTFLPCPNIAAAAHEINQLTARCEANPGSKADPTFCAIAAYHGSWERPDTAFARAVRATLSNNDGPNFDMPEETGIEIRDALFDTPSATQTRFPSRPEHPSEGNERAWSSALFPAKPEHIRRCGHQRSDCKENAVAASAKHSTFRQWLVCAPVADGRAVSGNFRSS